MINFYPVISMISGHSINIISKNVTVGLVINEFRISFDWLLVCIMFLFTPTLIQLFRDYVWYDQGTCSLIMVIRCCEYLHYLRGIFVVIEGLRSFHIVPGSERSRQTKIWFIVFSSPLHNHYYFYLTTISHNKINLDAVRNSTNAFRVVN